MTTESLVIQFKISLTTSVTYLCNLASYELRSPWGWRNSVETCGGSVIICQLIVHQLVVVQNNKRCSVQSVKINNSPDTLPRCCTSATRTAVHKIYSSQNMLLFFRLLWPSVMNIGWRERKTNKMQILWYLLSSVYVNMFQAPLCPSSGEQDCVLPQLVFCTGCAGCGCVELGCELCELCVGTTSAEHHMR